jgi:anti-sigma regulatory factor (Ser/Thr protein kinase)
LEWDVQGPALERELWLRAVPASASVARAFVAEVADELRFDRPAKEQLRLAVTEAVANAVEHGAPCQEGLIGVSAYVEADRLATEVSDCGDFRLARQGPGELQERGRGLQLMFASVDDMEIDAAPGRTVVRLAKRLPQ